MVFDNANSTVARDCLQDTLEKGNIQHLVLGDENFSKAGAWYFINGEEPRKNIACADRSI